MIWFSFVFRLGSKQAFLTWFRLSATASPRIKAFERIRQTLNQRARKPQWQFLECNVCVAAWKKLHALGCLTQLNFDVKFWWQKLLWRGSHRFNRLVAAARHGETRPPVDMRYLRGLPSRGRSRRTRAANEWRASSNRSMKVLRKHCRMCGMIHLTAQLW